LPARVSLALFFLGVSGWALASLSRRSSFRTLLPVYTLTLTQFLWFLLPAVVELASGREIAQTRYSSGLLAVLHSTQYLWITSYYQRKEARAAGNVHWSFWGYLVTLIAGGIALFIPGPWIVSRVFHTDFAASFLTFTALVNVHHFILDGKIWKLRDSRIASVLLDDQQKTPDRPATKETSVARAAQWLTGGTAGARAVRVVTVVLLFAWAAVDQVHYWWSSNAGSLQALQRAVKLNPDDSSVLARLAVEQEAAGQRDAALETMKRAALLNPESSAIQESYGRLLVETGRNGEAYAQFRKMLQQWPRNANAWIDYGMLAHRLQHDEEAVDSWQKAVDADPTQPNAQLYLAQALDQQGQLQAAARHYRAYLELMAARHEKNPKASPELLAALIRIADADAAVNQTGDAIKGYRSAVGFAQKSGEKTLQSLALAHLADLQEKQGDAAGAAQSYQRALQLDAGLSDPHSAVSDWFNYAQFLRKQGEPERYALACLLKADAALKGKGASADEVSAVKQALEESEQRLGKAAASVRQESDALAAEALKLEISNGAAKQ
jgi:tetratricopeptide (TPR) repeat protein